MKTENTDASPFVAERWAELIELHADATFLELESFPDYGFTGAVLWTSFMDGLTDYYFALPVIYEKYAKFNVDRDDTRIRRAAEFLHEFVRRAHHRNITVMHLYHPCNLVPGAVKMGSRYEDALPAIERHYPDWLNAAGEPDFSKDCFYDFMAAEIDQFFTEIPGVDGLTCFNCECSVFTPSVLRHQDISITEIVERAVDTVYGVCAKHGKRMVHDIHSGGANEEMSRAIIAACRKHPEIVIGADCTYSDWQFFLDTTPWVPEMKKNNPFYISFDVAGEFFGKGVMLGGWPGWITKHFANIREHRPDILCCRTALPKYSSFASALTRINLQIIGGLGHNGTVDIDAELEEWWGREFSGEWCDELKEMITTTMEPAIGMIFHINGVGMTNLAGLYNSIWVNEAEKKVWFWEQWAEPGTPIDFSMVPEFGRETRPFAELQEEKRNGIALCENAIATIERLELPEDTCRFFVTRFRQAVDVANGFLHMMRAAYAMHQLAVNHYDETIADPAAMLTGAQASVREQADAMTERWGPDFFERIADQMRAFADSIDLAQ